MGTNGFLDQELSLIPGNQSRKTFVSPVATCFIVKLLPLLSFIFFTLIGSVDSIIAVITIIFIFIEFIFIKYSSGFNLVGLKWSIDLSSMSFHWYSKPEPFVPVLSNTNFFWMSFFAFLVIWLICFFISFFSSTKTKALVSLISFICEGVNFYMFSKAHNYAKKQVEKAVLNSIQEEVKFDLVPENDLEANSRENINNDQDDKGKNNDSYFNSKKTTKVLDTTSVELPPPLMPVNNISENKDKNEVENIQINDNSSLENNNSNIENNNNDTENKDKNEEEDIQINDNSNLENNNNDTENKDKNEDDDIDFY